MKMKLKFSYILSIALFVGVALWMVNGEIIVSGQVDAANAVAPPAQRLDDDSEKLFKVNVRQSNAIPHESTLDISGRIESPSKIVVRAEVSGKLLERPIEKGTRVKAGQTLCIIDKGTKSTRLLEAQALLESAQSTYDSTSSLIESGVATVNQVSSLKANLDSAKARVVEAREHLENTTVKAPIGGRIESPIAEIGSFLNVGESCATIITTEAMIAVVQVSELDIVKLKEGMKAQVNTISGVSAKGVVTYIAHTADSATRTFRVEVEVPNTDGRLRDGVSASVKISLPLQLVHSVNSSVLTLDDKGLVGVQTVNEENVVEFYPALVAGRESDQLLVAGLPKTTRIITVGQEYVIDGQKVAPIK